jgi:MFS transporter, OCT family, solute carrier family 22 (organic cation transporter), member 4/5
MHLSDDDIIAIDVFCDTSIARICSHVSQQQVGRCCCCHLSVHQSRFLLLLINQFIGGIDMYVLSFLILIEITTSSYATLVGNLALVAYAIGEIIIAGMAYVAQHWLLLKWMMTLYMTALIPYLYFLPESPQWLLAKGRYEDLEKTLYRMARFNRRSTTQWLPLYRRLVNAHLRSKAEQHNRKVRLSSCAKIQRFVTHTPTMSKLLISGVIGFVTLLLYFKIAFNLGQTDDISPYLNLIIGAFVEILGYIVASLLMMRFNRKPMLMLFLVLTALCLILTPHSWNSSSSTVILVAQLGKFAISGTACVTYIYAPELFPTSIRGTGMGVFVLFSRVGSILAPIIDAWIDHDQSAMLYMYYVYALLSVLIICLIFFLPETRNVPLAEKIDYHN